jgi:hypothetical protein
MTQGDNMDIAQLITALSPDRHYKIIGYLGILTTGYALTAGPVQVVTHAQLATLGLGLILMGIGERVNTYTHHEITPPNAWTGGHIIDWEKIEYKPVWSGVLFDLIGLGLIISVIVFIIRAAYTVP